jgi:asparagine synthase (glutamine-hydrolysing)
MDKQRPKPLLLDALGKLLPEEVWRRPKMGFTLPFSRWMGSALKPELEGALLGDNTLGNLGINSDYVRQVWNAFKNNPQHEPWSRSWALYVLKRWCEENGVTA